MLGRFDPDSTLALDLAFMKREFGIDNVWFRLSFPDNFPFAPPFVRVLAPLVQGGCVACLLTCLFNRAGLCCTAEPSVWSS